MARYRVCRACHGKGKVECWACGGSEDHPSSTGKPDDPFSDAHCPECVDGKEVCLDCSGDGGEYIE